MPSSAPSKTTALSSRKRKQRRNITAKYRRSSANSVCDHRFTESTAIALIVSGAALTTESTTLVEGAAGPAPLLQAARPAKASTIKKILIVIIYFFRKYKRSGTPLKLNDSRSLFSR